MSFVNSDTSFIKNEDGSSTFTITMDDVTTKCMECVAPDIEVWISNAVDNRTRIEGNRIYKSEIERHLEAGTMPSAPTKQSLILAYEKPITETPDTV